MMKLHGVNRSPFVRKVMVTAHETGLAERIDMVATPVSPIAPSAELNAGNPLGKIPCLITEDGMPLYDSRVICEYLDSLHDGTKMFPAEPERRWPVLRLAALADGIADAVVGVQYERTLRPVDRQWEVWRDNQLLKARRALDFAETRAASWKPEHLCIGQIGLACTLGYVDFRFTDENWRHGRPQLAAWFETFLERPSMRATEPA